jgi:hypothetical protein
MKCQGQKNRFRLLAATVPIANQIQGARYWALRSPLMGLFVLIPVWLKIFINNSLANIKSLRTAFVLKVTCESQHTAEAIYVRLRDAKPGRFDQQLPNHF